MSTDQSYQGSYARPRLPEHLQRRESRPLPPATAGSSSASPHGSRSMPTSQVHHSSPVAQYVPSGSVYPSSATHYVLTPTVLPSVVDPRVTYHPHYAVPGQHQVVTSHHPSYYADHGLGPSNSGGRYSHDDQNDSDGRRGSRNGLRYADEHVKEGSHTRRSPDHGDVRGEKNIDGYRDRSTYHPERLTQTSHDVRRKRSRSTTPHTDSNSSPTKTASNASTAKRVRGNDSGPNSGPGPSSMGQVQMRRTGSGANANVIGPGGEHRTEEDELQDSDDGAEGRRDLVGLSKEEVRKVKNRDKQRRLRERRANQLDELQSQSSGLQAEITSLRTALEAQAESFARREEASRRRIQELEKAGSATSNAGISPGTILPDGQRANPFETLSIGGGEHGGLTLSNYALSGSYGRRTPAARQSGDSSSLGGIQQTFDNSTSLRPGALMSRDSASSSGSSYFGSMYPASETVGGSYSGKGTPGDHSLVHLPFPHSIELPTFGQVQYVTKSPFWAPEGQHDQLPEDDRISQTSEQRINAAKAPYTLEALDFLLEEDVLAIPRLQAVTMARFLIMKKLSEPAFTPNELLSTSYAVEHAKSMRDREAREGGGPLISAIPGVGPSELKPHWRGLFTPAQVYLLMRVLMDFCHDPASKQYFDDMRIHELKDVEKARIHQEWRARPDRDMRVELIPAMQLRYRLIEHDELKARQEGLGMTELLEDFLFEGRLYGNPYEMYAWELPDIFWDRWKRVYPHGKRLCQSLRPWRRREGLKGSEVFAILMGSEVKGARNLEVPGGMIGLPPAGWQGDDGQSAWRAKATGT